VNSLEENKEDMNISMTYSPSFSTPSFHTSTCSMSPTFLVGSLHKHKEETIQHRSPIIIQQQHEPAAVVVVAEQQHQVVEPLLVPLYRIAAMNETSLTRYDLTRPSVVSESLEDLLMEGLTRNFQQQHEPAVVEQQATILYATVEGNSHIGSPIQSNTPSPTRNSSSPSSYSTSSDNESYVTTTTTTTTTTTSRLSPSSGMITKKTSSRKRKKKESVISEDAIKFHVYNPNVQTRKKRIPNKQYRKQDQCSP
jgi:hypothetical protein